MNVMDGDMREHQARAAGGAHHDGVFGVGQGRQNVAKRHGFRTARAERVLFNQFLIDPDILPPTAFFAPGRVRHEVAILGWHDIEELFTDLNSLFAHGLSPRPLSGFSVRLSGITQLPRPARVATDFPSDRWMCSTITSGGIVMPPATCGPAITRSESAMVALISRAIQPATLNSGTKMCFACFVASRIS